MKKLWISLGALSMFMAAGLFIRPSGLFAEPVNSDYDAVAQEAGRNRELLDIWKDHVKTVTKERDDAYRQLEQLRASSPSGVARFGGMETMPLPNPQTAQQIEGLRSEVTRLQTELTNKASSGGDPNRELQMQFSALQSQFQQAKKDLNEARSEKDRIIQDKEKAMSKAERLESEVETLRAGGSVPAVSSAPAEDPAQLIAARAEANSFRDQNIRLQSEVQRLRDANSQFTSASGSPDREQDAFARQARELQYENETLKARVQKLEVVEKELANTRGYFSPLVKELQDENNKLNSDNASMGLDLSRYQRESSKAAGDIEAARAQALQSLTESERLSAEVDSLKTQKQTVEADFRTAQAEKDQIASQIESYRNQLQMAAADREKTKSLELQYQTLKDQNESLQKAYEVLERSSNSSEARARELSTQMTAIQNDNRDLAAREAGNLKAIEKYKSALAANLADMKNLKANFEAYLESLVASFEERQK